MNPINQQKTIMDLNQEQINHISKLKDKELLNRFELLVKQEKEATAFVVAHLAEIDKRKLFALEGYSSLFNYCVEKYHYSEGAAYRRVQAARLSLKFPEIVDLLKEGKLNLMIISLISPHLTQENKEKILAQTFKKSTREVENMISYVFGKEKIIRDKIKILSQAISQVKKEDNPKIAQSFTFSAESKSDGKEGIRKEQEIRNQKEEEKSLVLSLSSMVTPEPKENEMRRVKIEFVAKEDLAKKIERAKKILRHKYPQGKLEDIFNEALELLLEKKDPQRRIERLEKTKKNTEGEIKDISKKDLSRPKSNSHSESRYIPQSLKLDIYKRDHGQCSYVSKDGKLCREKNFLEIDHIQPWALQGKSTSDNLRLLCRVHNQYRSQKTFGFRM